VTLSIGILIAASLTIRGATDQLQRGATVTVAGETICAEHPLPRFYAQRNYAPAWTVDGKLAPVATSLLDAIEHAPDHGLRPADYHIDAIRTAHDDELDLLLTDAFFLLASHLASGRVDPISMEPTWCLPSRPVDLAGVLEEALDNGDVRDVLERVGPAHPQYAQLRTELSRLRGMQWGTVTRGHADQVIARLTAGGEFDGDLDRSLKRFQRLHGLTVDGVAGPRTIAELNVPVAERIRQIEVNLERLRWMPATLGDRYALVNIPAFRLMVFDRGPIALSMRIVVGQALKRTPVFSTTVTQVIFNPSWYVPDSIADEELWPAQRRNHSYLKSQHMEVLANGSIRQKPGPWNALGRIKFNMPNGFSVYMHDTPAQTLFEASVRTFSHGCIRLEKPDELAAYLGVEPCSDREECSVDVQSPLPVHILYFTAFTGDDGEVHYAPDVYGRDVVLAGAMRRRPDRF
jgi:L,D-transpeptidase YcbB